MGSMKTVRLSMLFLAIGTFFVASSALGAGGVSGTLTPLETSDEQDASGVVRATQLKYVPPGPWQWEHYEGRMTITCKGLSPGKTYSSSAGEFIADKTGAGKAEGAFSLAPRVRVGVGVWRVVTDPDGTTTSVLVLDGWFTMP